MFPTAEVARITGVSPDSGPGDTYCRWKDGTLSQLQDLVNVGAADPEECQNSSPAIKEFLEALAPYGDKVKLIGYIIFPPRGDARVSVEGFTMSGLTADEAVSLMNDFGHADERDSKKEGSTYSVRFWWD